jgi:hypothetical protein
VNEGCFSANDTRDYLASSRHIQLHLSEMLSYGQVIGSSLATSRLPVTNDNKSVAIAYDTSQLPVAVLQLPDLQEFSLSSRPLCRAGIEKAGHS